MAGSVDFICLAIAQIAVPITLSWMSSINVLIIIVGTVHFFQSSRAQDSQCSLKYLKKDAVFICGAYIVEAFFLLKSKFGIFEKVLLDNYFKN